MLTAAVLRLGSPVFFGVEMASEDVAVDDLKKAAEEVRDLGSTVLREAWPLEPLGTLRQAIEAFCDIRRRKILDGDTSPHARMYATHGIGTFGALVNAGLIHREVLPAMFRGGAFHRLCQAYWGGDDFYVAINRLGFRNHHPIQSDRSFIPYHQDSYTQDVRTPQVLNCWIPLDPGAGRDAPGLEVVRHPCRPDFPRKDFGLRSENAAYDNITIDRARIVEEYGEQFMAPEFEVGDGLVFSENVIHRTYVTEGMTRPRINFEFRVFSGAHLRPGVQIAELGPLVERVS
ncbi:hypothetical protein [Phenylobacterium sp.]|uniref:hypothetical protein n=1 Tax=Phenylobacterium sp. TaxID=1871053 RepID=UPI0011FDC0BB|nr:hypothetical protein [Phenylobacterium sp.]THD58283.1 MAG: hypothetical protein E8A49_20090 [Phenylobacterium sp.]